MRDSSSRPPRREPGCIWFWLDGNITEEGITADLEAMQRVGLGGALWMWGGGVGEGVRGPVKFLDPQWWELMRHTVREADRLGLQINLTAGSGWSHSGGPWITPEHGMRRLERSREIRLEGPGLKDIELPGGDALVAVLAYPLREEDAMGKAGVKVVPSSVAPDFLVANALDRKLATRWISKGAKAGDGPTEAHPEWLVFEFPEPYKAAALYLAPFHDCGPRQCRWQVSKDGKEYETISSFELAPDAARTIPFEAPAARFFRLLVTSAYPFQGQDSWNVQIAEIQLLAKGEQPSQETALESRAVVDLTAKLDSSGHLSWQVPSGAWTLQMFRHAATGDQPHPILSDEGGLECDKLSREAVEAHWTGYIRRVLDECGPAARRVIRWVHADSYEFGPQTWTPKFREEFMRRRGYDPVPFLPAVLGTVVDDASISARFLWDFKRVRADLFAEAIGGHLRELCRREGVALTTEPHLIPEVFDQIQYGGNVSEPVGNFLGERRTAWYAPNPPVGPEVHLAKGEASAASTYGLNGVVWAEAFTGVDHAHAWKETPEYLKTWGDLWLSEGGMTQVIAPLGMLGADRWHDLVARYDGAKVQLFVDGVWFDEGFPLGALRRDNTDPCLLGAQSRGDAVDTGFRGQVDHAALWNRALSDAEIETLSGGRDEVAAACRRILGEPVALTLESGPNVSGDARNATVRAGTETACATLGPAPRDFRLTLRAAPGAGVAAYGVRLRAGEQGARGHVIRLVPARREARVGAGAIGEVDALDRPISLQIVLRGDILDVCVDGRRTLIDVVHELPAGKLVLFSEGGETAFEEIELRSLANSRG